MITVKTPEEIKILREGGRRLAGILHKVAQHAVSGVSTLELDTCARTLAIEGGDTPSFLGYRPHGAKRLYPASLCVSINDEVVHGIPNESPKILKEGDIVSLDMGLIHRKLITDCAITIGVGVIDAEAIKLLEITKKALSKGIGAIKAGHTTGDIGYAVERCIKPYGYGIVRELAGHGVGYEIHEDPYIPNFGKKGEGETLRAGMVIAIEPMINEGTEKVLLDKDGYTFRTKDGKRSAHFEHTVAITEKGAVILTLP